MKNPDEIKADALAAFRKEIGDRPYEVDLTQDGADGMLRVFMFHKNRAIPVYATWMLDPEELKTQGAYRETLAYVAKVNVAAFDDQLEQMKKLLAEGQSEI